LSTAISPVPESAGRLLALAGAALIGLAVIAPLLESGASPPPWGTMAIDTTLVFVAQGSALLSHAASRRRAFRLASGVALGIAVANLLSAFTGFPLSAHDFAVALAGPLPGPRFMDPMAPNTAFTVMIANALLLLPHGEPSRRRAWLLGIGHTIVLILAAAPLLGYMLSLAPATRWFSFPPMAAPTALGLFLGAAAALGTLLGVHRVYAPGAPVRWAPTALGLGSVLLSVFLYQALREEQQIHARALTESTATGIVRVIDARLDAQLGMLQRSAQRMMAAPLDEAWARWQRDVGYYIEGGHFQALVWLDPWRDIHKAAFAGTGNPAQLEAFIAELQQGGQALLEAPRRGAHVLMGPASLYALVRPLARSGDTDGTLIAVADLEAQFRERLRPFIESGYQVRLMAQGEKVYQIPSDPWPADPPVVAAKSSVGGWTVTVAPSPARLAQSRTTLPELVLGLGSVLGLTAALLLAGRQRLQADTGSLRREVEHATDYDTLTGLPNRRVLDRHLQRGRSGTRRPSDALAVMLLDIDHFKEINDSLGRPAGDALLKAIAERLNQLLIGSGILVARTGGDEFVLLGGGLPDAQAVAALADDIIEKLRVPFTLEGTEVRISVSLGIAMAPRGADAERNRSGSVLLESADTAMHHAKASGRNRYEFFSPALQARALERIALRNALAKAITEDALTVHYQPRVDLASHRMVGAEALARWTHPEFGCVSPELFIAIADETGLINGVGRCVLRRICHDLAHWERRGTPLPVISLNASAHQLRDGELLGELRRCLGEHPTFRDHLEVELTERVLIEDGGEQFQRLRELRTLGIRIAIDDFGSGYSSFSYLRRLPIDVLKIDKSFVADLEHDGSATAIVRSILNLAANLGLRVVAEGVERDDQLRWLRDNGCHEAQGFVLGHPVPVEAFVERWYRSA
jgi:diguanylate cyclase (GGDEF)-like protein